LILRRKSLLWDRLLLKWRAVCVSFMSLLTSSNLETSWWYKVLAFDWPWSVSLMLLAFLAGGVNNPSWNCHFQFASKSTMFWFETNPYQLAFQCSPPQFEPNTQIWDSNNLLLLTPLFIPNNLEVLYKDAFIKWLLSSPNAERGPNPPLWIKHYIHIHFHQIKVICSHI